MEQNKIQEKEEKVNYLLYAVVFVIILILATFAVTYAYFKFNVEHDTTLVNINSSLECIDLSITEGATDIGLTYNYPITDNKALNGGATPVTVTVTNNCDNDVKYTLALSTMSLTGNESSYIEDSKVRYKIKRNNADFKGVDYLNKMTKIAKDSNLYSDLTGDNGELKTKYPNYTLKEIYSIDDLVTIASNSSNTYEIYMWVDYFEGDAAMYTDPDSEHDESYDGTTKGKKFSAAVSISFNTGEANEELNAGKTILTSSPSGLNTTLEGGLYRFQGTNDTVNNYLCFGYSDYEADCDFTNTTNSDLYAYRIIGINSSGQLKLIKKEALNSTMTWNSSTGVTWPNSGAYSSLNGSTFYTNTTYVPTSWQSKIAETSWKYGDITTSNTTASAVYTTESEWTSTTSAKIGLMYMHDYYYAYQSGGLNCSSSGSYSTCKTAWLHLSVNDSSAPSALEWTMSRYNSGIAWHVTSDGNIYGNGMSISRSVRPVFYLTTDIQLIDGTGQSSDPFIIE